MKGGKVKVKKSTDQNLSNPYAQYIESIESSSKSKPSLPGSSSSKRSITSADPIIDSKDKNDQEALDMVSARRDLELCKTPEEISALKANLQPKIIRRLKKLSDMEQIPRVGKEIADAADFLQLLNR
ncbi:uncharacterized protein LOC120004479 [Tripterygium wilfordii]|uniref:uncharacterized protein LOC120004479 n=1 Tax=Tripterygium wilfordii TaxID=458696 RepID=UPI0018F809E0|nr:uncharacterized protein LOC120004479 [Tripterygium wilfordii]